LVESPRVHPDGGAGAAVDVDRLCEVPGRERVDAGVVAQHLRCGSGGEVVVVRGAATAVEVHAVQTFGLQQMMEARSEREGRRERDDREGGPERRTPNGNLRPPAAALEGHA